MKNNKHFALPLSACLALLSSATSTTVIADDNFELNGYFRAGITSLADGGTNDNGACYSLAHPSNDGLYYRLGNECRDYGEFFLTKKFSKNGLDIKGVIGMDLAGSNQNSTATTSWSRRERQMYVEIDGAFENGTSMWIGRRYYRDTAVGDVHIIDAFHVNSAGNGFGFEDIPFGSDHKLHLALIAENSEADSGGRADDQNFLFDSRVDFGLGSAGRLKFVLQQLFNNETEGVDTIDGNTVTLQWDKNIGGVFDQKTVFQLGSDAFANNPGCWGSDGAGAGNCFNTDPSQDGLQGTRIFNNGTWHFNDRFVMNTMVMVEDIDDTREVLSIGLRPHYSISKYWSVLGEIGINEVEEENTDKQTLNKVTLGIQLSADSKNFWERPSLRFFVSHFDWNDAARDGSSGLRVVDDPEKTDSLLFGAQAEYWF